MITVDKNHFTFIRPITWKEVFDSWRNNEAHQKRWIDHYKDRGFESWDEWRQNHITPLKLAEREWFLYRISHPLESAPQFFGGPFKSWKTRYYGKNDTLTFATLAAIPDIYTNQTINKLLDSFPSPTTLIGFWQENKIVIGEGMHRCCALALAARRNILLTPKITIALADFSESEIPLLKQARKR